MEEMKQSTIDQDVLDAMKNKVEMATSSQEEMNRCMLNFLAEELSLMKKINESMERLYATINMAYSEETTRYFEELTQNFKQEEARQKVKKDIAKSHLSKDIAK